MKNKLFSSLLAVIMLFSTVTINADTTANIADYSNDTGVSLFDDITGVCGKGGDILIWTLDANGTLTISGKGKMADYDSYGPWYDYKGNIKAAVIKDDVSYIGTSAFYGCSSLKSISIPDSVSSIGKNAFDECTALTSINIPQSVSSINDMTFYGCSSLESISIPNISSIGENAFADCYSLTDISMPDSLVSIGDSAFYGCTSLTSIDIPASVSSIGTAALDYCTSLTEINVNENNEYYTSDDGILFNKAKTKLIKYPCGKSGVSYDIPDSVSSIEYAAFDYCSSLESITIPASVTSVGEYAFDNCTSLTEINVDKFNNYFTSDDGILFDKNKTKIIKYPAKKSGVSYDIPDSVSSIAKRAFEGCISLKNISIPNSFKSIGEYAFYNCSSLKNISIPKSVSSIGMSAFYQCYKLTDVYYSGTEQQWGKITIGGRNDKLTKANIHYESTMPSPTPEPTSTPTTEPTTEPTSKPSTEPTSKPTTAPTSKPTINPTVKPTTIPTNKPTSKPTTNPTVKPTTIPTVKPTINPTGIPTINPTIKPTANPTSIPTSNPTAEPIPTTEPTAEPIKIVPVETEAPVCIDFDGKVTVDFKVGIDGNAELNIKNIDPDNSQKIQTAAYAAYFDSRGNLTGVEILTSDEQGNYSFNIKNGNYKIMLWDNFKPIINAIKQMR